MTVKGNKCSVSEECKVGSIKDGKQGSALPSLESTGKSKKISKNPVNAS